MSPQDKAGSLLPKSDWLDCNKQLPETDMKVKWLCYLTV